MRKEFEVLTTVIVFESSQCFYASIFQIKSLKSVNPTRWSWKKVAMVKLFREVNWKGKNWNKFFPLLESHKAYLHNKISQKSHPKEIN